MKTAFILNTKKSGLSEWREKLESEFAGDFELWPTSAAGDERKLALKAAKERFTHLVAIGGDGTINECVNALVHYKKDNPDFPMPVFGIIPNGTGNDFIKSADWSFSLESLYDRIIRGSEKKIDLGILNYGNGQTEYFVNIADAGIGPQVIEKVAQSKSRFGSSLTFASAIIKTFFTFKKRILHCSGESFHFSGPAVAIIAANGRFFGGGLCIAPEAELDDGLIDVVIIGNVTVMDFLKYLPQLRKGSIIDHPKVRYYRTSKLEISGEGELEKDGQMGLELPVNISIESRFLRIIA